MFALVDCNNFYASCERVFKPQLKHTPIVVLSNNDGCVIARSNEAKKLGVPMGATAYKFKEFFEENKIVVFSSNYALYGDMSSRVMNSLREFAPEIEVYSIDEAFLDLRSIESHYDLAEYAATIQTSITQNVGIPVSIGVAKTKALAKLANKIAKKFASKTNNVYLIDTEEKRIKALKWLPIGDVWGIGRQNAKKLTAMNINHAFDFTLLPDDYVKKHFTIVGLRLKHELQNIPRLDMELPQPKKCIATTRSFDTNYSDYQKIRERISTFAASCAEKLRQQNSNCSAVMVFIHTNYHRKELAQYSKNMVINLPYATNSSIELIKFSVYALDKIFKHGYQYKKAGVIVMEITPENTMQMNIFEQPNPKHKPVMETIDAVNKTNGKQIIKFGCQDQQRTWKMRQEQLSPCYTTKLSDLIKIKT